MTDQTPPVPHEDDAHAPELCTADLDAVSGGYSNDPLERAACYNCSGSGKCWNCSGTGYSAGAVCAQCSGTGKCYYCGGQGYR